MIGFSLRFNRTFLTYHSLAWLIYAIHIVFGLAISLMVKSGTVVIGFNILTFLFQFSTFAFIFLFSAGMYILFTKKISAT
ncbi:hypothetical protein DCC35_03255 [Mangrovivirga cuniculi]|uniref:Uncharacterized protein n=1 Tax=Mangrovivirga cuniculi TaxID=2715131 RepID=A0A4D7JSC8_9BACT|nr:hypothetical protein DCC35_03255 [Mangrovivirga cuniculi]